MANAPPYAYHRLIVGYHGCDESTVEDVLMRGKQLTPSENLYDWLGKGIYFWEHGPQRALEFAREQKKRKRVDKPAVLGAYIYLGRCFDLTDTWATEQLFEFHEVLEEGFENDGKPLPKNKKAREDDHDLLLRNLDCAVINLCIDSLDRGEEGGAYYQTVRGVFIEGEEAFPGSRVMTKTHVQIAVRDSSCILGFFLPAQSYT